MKEITRGTVFRIILVFSISLLVPSICAPIWAQNKLTIEDNNTVKGNIHVGNVTKYSGLSKAQAQKLNELDEQVKNILDQIILLNKNTDETGQLRDSVLKMSLMLSQYQKEINDLIRQNDSIIKSRQNDSLFRLELEKLHDQKMVENLEEFWISYPYFNPFSNTAVVHYLQSTTNTVINSFKINSGEGVIYNGTKYFFEGQGINTVTGWEGKNINSINIPVPNFGVYSLGQMKAYYMTYNDLKLNRKTIIDGQMSTYRTNKNVAVVDVASGMIECNSTVGNVKLINQAGDKIRLWYCPGNSPCSRHRTQNHYTIFPNQTQELFDLNEGVYSYDSMKGSGLLYPYKNGQFKVKKCQTITVPL